MNVPAALPELDLEKEILWIRGDVSYANVLATIQKGESFFKNISHLQINLRDVQAHDSAWLTMLLSWYRYAQKHGKTFHCMVESPALLQTAKVYDLSVLLPIN